MTDPREGNEQSIGDEQQADREEAQSEVRAEESNDAQSAQSDPSESGEASQ